MTLEDTQLVGSCLGEVVVEELEELASPPERRHRQGRKYSTPRMVGQSILNNPHLILE